MIGNAVTVTFVDGFSITLNRQAVGSSNRWRTHVEASAADLAEVSGATRPTLRHGELGDGSISKLQVGSDTCNFSKASDLTRICITPDDATDGCEEN